MEILVTGFEFKLMHLERGLFCRKVFKTTESLNASQFLVNRCYQKRRILTAFSTIVGVDVLRILLKNWVFFEVTKGY